MGPILQEQKKLSFGQTFARGASQGLEKYQEFEQLKRQKEGQLQAAEKLGIPPEVFNLPKEGQAEYFKNQFAKEKPLNELQLSQKALNEARLGQVQSQQNLFNSLSGKNPQTTDNTETQENQQNFQNNSQSQESKLSKIPEDKLVQMAAFAGQPGESGVIGEMAKNEISRRKEEENVKRQTFEKEREYHTKYSKQIEEDVLNTRRAISKTSNALDFARNAVESDEVGAFSLSNLGERLGIPELQTAKGAQLVTASKENLLGNMNKVSAKAQNVWLEQRMNSMFPQVGKSKEANLTMQEMLESELALDKAYVDEFDRLSEEDDKNYGYVRKDIDKRVRSAIKPMENHVMRRASYRIKELDEQEKGLSGLKTEFTKSLKGVYKGTPLTLSMAKLYKDKFGKDALKVAEKNGFYVPELEEWSSYQQRPQEFREEL